MIVMISQNTVEGGCLCGSIRFAISQPLAPAAYCLCSDCRKMTGSAFSINIPVALENFRLLSGLPKSFTKAGGSGAKLTRRFCPDCGSPVYGFSEQHPSHIYVKAGLIDDPSYVIPTYQSYTSSAAPWAQIPPGLPSYAKSKSSSTQPRNPTFE